MDETRPTPRLVNPATLAPPRGYSNGVFVPAGAASGLLFIAGQVGWNARGQLVGDRFVDQFDRALANVLAVVGEMGGRPESIGQLRIFVTDKTEYLAARRELGPVWRRHMGRYYPAISLVEVKGLVEPGARVEIEGVAVI